MNRIQFLLVFLLVIIINFGCFCEGCDTEQYETTATIFLINKTSELVFRPETDYEIQPGDTLVHIENFIVEASEPPNVDT